MKMRSRFRNRVTFIRTPRPPEGYEATRISNKWGKLWWIIKKGLLVIAILTCLTAIVFWAKAVNARSVLYQIIGILVGLFLLSISLSAVSKFRVSITKVVLIPILVAFYAIYTFLYLLNTAPH